MDIGKIFEMFKSDEGIDEIGDDSYINFKQSPLYWIGMYKKLVQNSSSFNESIVKFFKESNEELDVSEMSDAGEWLTYCKAWGYIKSINLKDEYHIEIIKKCSSEGLSDTLESGISYFEKKEMYEECAHLKGILDKSGE